MPALTTLGSEVTNVAGNCVWILIGDEELALPCSNFSWFKKNIMEQILNALHPSADLL